EAATRLTSSEKAGRMPRAPARIPKGFRHSAQGCEERATLGNRFQMGSNPERVAPWSGRGPTDDVTLSGFGPLLHDTQGRIAAPFPRRFNPGLNDRIPSGFNTAAARCAPLRSMCPRMCIEELH